MIREPTDTDVLLGRGVSTNRHPGNVNFRNIVSEHVTVYVTSTKKQKMMISRSIVDKVRKELNPPGRFLEKECNGLWAEVDTKKALEKTAQALRDGAFPLRKQLSEDFTDSGLLAAVFDDVEDCEIDINLTEKAFHPLISNQRAHRRQFSAPVIQNIAVNVPDELPDPKRCKPSFPQTEDLKRNNNSNQSLTGINFPSPGVSEEGIEFLIGSNAMDARSNTRKQHRRNRTFGGYSCSDRNVSDMHIDEIFAMFTGSSDQPTSSQQQPATQNTMPDIMLNQYQKPPTSSFCNMQSNVGPALDKLNSINFNVNGTSQNVFNQNVNALLPNLFSTNQQLQSPTPNQEDPMSFSPQSSPANQVHLGQNELAFELPHLLEQHHQECSDMQVARSSLSGVKRHRRYNTIANVHCFSGHQNNLSVPSNFNSTSEQLNFTFLNDINPHEVSLQNEANTLESNGGSCYPAFNDSINIEVYKMPLKDPAQACTNGRHRRTKTTGNIDLPQDWNFQLEKPSLNTIHEEIPNYPLTHECGSLMSSHAETGDSSLCNSERKPTSMSSVNTQHSFLPGSIQGHTRDTSSKSSLSNEDFCMHLMAGGVWDGLQDGDEENDGFLTANNK